LAIAAFPAVARQGTTAPSETRPVGSAAATHEAAARAVNRASVVPAVVAALAEEAGVGDSTDLGKRRQTMRSKSFISALARVWLLIPLVILSCCFTQAQEQSTAKQTASPSQMQKKFDTPQLAMQALVQASDPYDANAMVEILGPEGKEIVQSADPVQDKNRAEHFAAMAREKNSVTVDPKNPARATVLVGNNDWPFPVPLIKKGGKWLFDSKAGKQEIVYRRVGANELDAIQVCRGFVDAQEEYASDIHDNSGIHQYAQKIISTPGKHDGLYWKNEDGSAGGPVGEAVARAIDEGYSAKERSGYHGYYFKVLKGQGPAAPLGQLDYMVGGAMIGGFALVAVPAEYRVTGVNTFMVSYNGIVYEKDLGQDSLNIVKAMDRYNPDKTWHRTDDQWPENDQASDAAAE
jgi:hypothetical protein